MLLDQVFRLSWISLLLFSSGSGHPYQVKVPQGVQGVPGLGKFFGGAGHGYYYDPSSGKYYGFGGVKGGSGSDGSGTDGSDGSGGSGSGGSGSGGSGSGGSGSGGSGSGGSGSGGSGGSGSGGSGSGGSGGSDGSGGSGGSDGSGGSGGKYYYYYGSGSGSGSGGSGSGSGGSGSGGSGSGGSGSGGSGSGGSGSGGSGSGGSGSGGSGSGGSGSGGSGSGGSGSGGSGGSGSGGSGSGGSGSDGVSGLPFYLVDPQDFDLTELKLPEFPFPNHWLYPDVPVGTVPEFLQLPSVRVVQNSNDYQRARSLVAHTKYTQDDWDILPFLGDQDQGGQVSQVPSGQDPYVPKNPWVKW